MSWKKYSYFCPQCKESIDKIADAFIVDENRPEAFCSEICIVQYYSQQIKHFEEQEIQLRKSLSLEDEKLKMSDDELSEYVELTLRSPKEIWVDKDELGNKYFYIINTVISNSKNIHVVLIAKFFAQKPSFIFHHVFTQNDDILSYYKSGQSLQADSDNQPEDDADLRKEELVLPKEIMDDMEQMRSEFVADMVSNRKDFDIDVEKFPLYENYIEMTLSDPDEVFEYKDSEKRDINVNIKAFSQSKETFFYFVICLKLDKRFGKEKSDDDILIPIISFPSVDKTIYEYYQKGSCTTKKSLN